jgi:hypothetical protein
MIIKSKLLEKYFGIEEFAFPENGNKIISEFYGKQRSVGDTLDVLVATAAINLPMYSNSGSYVKVGSEIRGMLPEELKATFKQGEILRYGEWVENPEVYKDLKVVKAKIKTVSIRPQSRGHEYYEVDI